MQFSIAVATVYGRPYYKITHALKLMDLRFKSLSPEQAAVSDAKIIITTEDEAQIVKRKDVLLDSEFDKYPVLLKAKMLRKVMGVQHDDQLTIGVDPGERIGIAIIYLHDELDSFVEASPESAFKLISTLLLGISSARKIVRIGDGNMAITWQIASMIKRKFNDLVHVEIVDEHGTSLPKYIGANRRGVRDRSSARAIALRDGRRFDQFRSYARI